MNLQRLIRSNYLENTRLLYTGIERLYHLWLDWRDSSGAGEASIFDPFDPQALWKCYYPLVEREESDAIVLKNTKNQVEKQAYQNRLTDFFIFLQEELQAAAQASSGKTKEEAVREQVAKLLCLFAITEDIKDHTRNSKIPYLFERLSNGMRDLVESDMCYLLYCRDDNISTLSMSSYKQDILQYELNCADFQGLHFGQERTKGERDAQMPLAQTISKAGLWKKSLDEDLEQYFHIIVLALDSPTPERERFYAVFQSGVPGMTRSSWDDPARGPGPQLQKTDIARMRNILFLNATLAGLLRENLHILMTSQQTFRYVQPLSVTEKLSVLHLTDLHIKEKDVKALENMFDQFPAADSEGRPFDLLVVTGDIVQGQCSAGELEAHYRRAEQLIRRLALRLWSCGEKGEYLRGDWRKRIAIIPGNHDYASMNELEVIHQSGSRSTGVGRPALKEGGPMVKFAYYLQFLQRLLGQDIGEAVQNWLNSVRYYHQMKLSLLCVNTVAGAGPLRNNKVHIDPDFVKKLERTGEFQGLDTICLAHHTPVYEANYAVDRYYTPKINSIKTLAGYVKDFQEIMETTNIPQAKGLLDKLYSKLESHHLRPEEDALMADVMFYRNNFREADNERCEAIRSSMRRDQNMQQADHKNQQEYFHKLTKIGEVKLFLGGHIHEVNLRADCHCYEGPRFYEGANACQYGVLTLDRAKNSHDWVCWQTTLTGSGPLTTYSVCGVPTETAALP